jgi:hypothetical protein
MSKGQTSSSERHGDTQEFEPIRPPEDVVERKEFDLPGHQRVPVRVDFSEPIELRLGRDEGTPTCYLIRRASHLDRKGTFAIVQPDTVRRYPGRGWVEPNLVDLIKLGREASPQFEFGPDVSRMHCLVAKTIAREGIEEAIEIENYGRNSLRVLVHPCDLLAEVEPFTPSKDDSAPEW